MTDDQLKQIAKALGVSFDNVAAFWPVLDNLLRSQCGGFYSSNVAIAALATIRIECPKFEPMKELGGDAYLQSKPYFPFYGRGFIQLTWKKNYQRYGDILGIDLVSDPDLALQPDVACGVFATFFHTEGCDKAAAAQDWTKVRRIVNGPGLHQLVDFLGYVEKLKPIFRD